MASSALRWLIAGLVAAICAAAGSATAPIDTMAAIRERGEIRLGHRESSFPLSFVAKDGTPSGYSIDICLRVVDAIRAELKRPDLKVRYVMLSPSDRIPAIVDGRVDIECGSTTNTIERRKSVEFSFTTFMAGARILTRTDSGIRSTGDLRGKRISVTAKTTTEDVIRSFDAGLALGLKIVTAADHAASFAMFENGAVDAVVNDDVNLLGLMVRSDRARHYAFVGKNLSAEPLSIAYRRSDPYFERVVDGAVATLFYGREVYGLYAKWFESAAPSLPMSLQMRENIKFPNKHGAI